MGRSTKIEDLPEEEEVEEVEYIEASNVEEGKSGDGMEQMKLFLLENMKEIIIVITIIVASSLGSGVIEKLPMVNSEYMKAIVKGVLGGVVFFAGKYYLIN